MNKKSPTEIVDLVTEDALDGSVVKLLEEKKDVSDTFIGGYFNKEQKNG